MSETCTSGAAVTYNAVGLLESAPGCTLVPDGGGRIAAGFDVDGDVHHSDFGVFQ